MLFSDVNYIIEGEAMLLELLEKYPDKLKVCFVGFTTVTVEEKVKQVKDFSVTKKDWLSDKSDEYITNHVKNMVVHSKKIKIACKVNNIAYFDTSNNFTESIENAMKYLLK